MSRIQPGKEDRNIQGLRWNTMIMQNRKFGKSKNKNGGMSKIGKKGNYQNQASVQQNHKEINKNEWKEKSQLSF